MKQVKRISSVRGFTLIELMITVAILGILLGIAVPNYMEYIRKGKRSEAKTALMESAQALERNYSVRGTYLNDDGDDLADVIIAQAPSTGTANYTIAASGTPTATTFTLQATRTGSMAGDACGDFTITHTGEQGLVNHTKSVEESMEECW